MLKIMFMRVDIMRECNLAEVSIITSKQLMLGSLKELCFLKINNTYNELREQISKSRFTGA